MSSVTVVDVGPRDGLQTASVTLGPDRRAELCMRISRAGVPRVEAVSFVDPKRVPQMAGAELVVRALGAEKTNGYCGLVLNETGFEHLVASGLKELRYTLAVSDEFNRRNSNRPAEESLAAAHRILRAAPACGLRVGVVLATAFGCPFSGEVPADRVLAIAAQLATAGATEIVFADTIGVATPRQIRTLLRASSGLNAALGVHLHNTRNTGYANAFVALEEGVDVIDASIGGLGGCPFAPGSSGNIATEDLVYLLDREGVETGIDLDALIETATWLEEFSGLSLDGQLHRAGPFPRPFGASNTN